MSESEMSIERWLCGPRSSLTTDSCRVPNLVPPGPLHGVRLAAPVEVGASSFGVTVAPAGPGPAGMAVRSPFGGRGM